MTDRERMEAMEAYLKHEIRYWERLRDKTTPHFSDKTLAEHFHDVWSGNAQVLLSAMWELRGEQSPTMREILAEEDE